MCVQVQVAAQMARASVVVRARFVVSTGDNFYPDGLRSVDDSAVGHSWHDVYNKHSDLQMPWNLVLGNHGTVTHCACHACHACHACRASRQCLRSRTAHAALLADYLGNCSAQLALSQKHPQWVMPARHFARTLPLSQQDSVFMAYLDTNPFITRYAASKAMQPCMKGAVNATVQLAWLRSQLAATNATWKIVVGHHPAYSDGLHGHNEELVQRLQPLLREMGVHAYIAGHDHDLQVRSACTCECRHCAPHSWLARAAPRGGWRAPHRVGGGLGGAPRAAVRLACVPACHARIRGSVGFRHNPAVPVRGPSRLRAALL